MIKKVVDVFGVRIALILIFILLFPLASMAQRIVLDRPYVRKYPLAIPMFQGTAQDPAERVTLSRDASEMLTELLEFTGVFDMLDRSAFPNIMLNDSGRPIVTYEEWLKIGAELLVTGNFYQNGDIVVMELRLFDTVSRGLKLGKRYKFHIRDLKKLVRRFGNEIIFQLTGKWGIFESKIAFVSTGTGHKEIFTCDFDGSNVSQFTHNRSINLFPAWSSDGRWLAYNSYARGSNALFIRNFKKNTGFIVSEKGINTTPAWVPGTFSLAATLSYQGHQNIYLLTGKGKITKRLTRHWGIDISPTWSPDGKKMAFVSNRSGSPQIYILDMDTKRVERLTFDGPYNTEPAWSPSGDKIAYSAMKGSSSNIRLIEPGSGKIWQITNSGRDESPSWSPDGSMIVFSSAREGEPRIYVMTANGSDQRRLLQLKGRQTHPAWSPGKIF